jgi:hypothetical protein
VKGVKQMVNLIPKRTRIEMYQYFDNGLISSTLTTSPKFFWIGYQYFKWLLWEFKFKFKDFEQVKYTFKFKKRYPWTVKIKINYYFKTFPNDCSSCDKFISYDMSVDDWTNICTYDNSRVDDCDLDYHFKLCHANYKNKHVENDGYVFKTK